MLILGIETSCDETAASIIKIEKNKIIVLSNIISSQIEIHKKYGGVVPEVAAREHMLNIIPVIKEAFDKAHIDYKKAKNIINTIAVTKGPGLITSLNVGVETAKTLSFAWKIPLIEVNHIEGHIYANFISNKNINDLKIFPSIILTVSGGHTSLVLMSGHGKYKIIGETRDDAAGEAFDKAAKLLKLGYPGGPIISVYADKFKSEIIKHKPVRSAGGSEIKLPRPMIDSKNFDFSFSGLKTALLYKIKKDKKWRKKLPEYCYKFQQSIVDVLISKTIKAAKQFKVKTIMISGGVSANDELRKQIKLEVERQLPKIK